MSATESVLEVRFEAMTPLNLDGVVAVDQQAYAHPWVLANFIDALDSGYQAQMLMAGDILVGYFVAMKGVDEVHLLNLTVPPRYQRQGWARVMLDALVVWSRGQGADWLWLEVRVGNLRALHVYESQGFRRVGQRKDYYPDLQGQREHATVMSLRL